MGQQSEDFAGLAMPGSTRHGRIFWIALTLLVLIVAATTSAVYMSARQLTAVVSHPQVPFEQYLAAVGLASTPATQLPGPVTIDRVVVDGEHTYVEYHLSQPWHGSTQTWADFTVTAIPGGLFSTGFNESCSPANGPHIAWLLDLLDQHPNVTRDCLARYDAVPPAARALRIQASVQVVPVPGATGHWWSPGSVTVPLDLRALRRRESVPLHERATMHGVTISLSHIYLWPVGGYLEAQVSGGFDAKSSVPHAYVNGQEVKTLAGSACSSSTCSQMWVLPPERHGARLTLVVPEVVYPWPSSAPPAHGPWQFAFTLP